MVSGAEKDRKMMPLTLKKSWKVALEIRGFWPENEGKMRPQSWIFFFKQKTAYEIMPSLVGSEMCIRDRFWPENEGKNEATTLDFFFCR